MSKKILLTVLAFALALSLSIFASAAEITSADDLLTLMNTPSMWADDYVLTTDINLADATNGLLQTPIGNTETLFTGTFDGDGHTISGIEISGGARVGLFGFAANATIKNLTIYGTVTGTGNAVGGFVGHVDTAAITIENCVNHCTVSGVDSVGGIIGRVETNSSVVNISKCVNYGTISSTRYAAGIAGFHSQTNGATTIENCINKGTISASTSYAAGISAYWRVYSGAADKCFVQDCMNEGSVTVTGSSGYAGGIIAYGSNKNYKYTITRCLNTGSITASKYSRPIAGTVSSATNTAGQFNNCYYTSTDEYTADSYGVETYVADFSNAANFAGLGENWILANGYAPELKVLHDHDENAPYIIVGDKHTKTCYCGEVLVDQEHNFVNGVCDKCGAQDIPCAHENKYEIVETVATCTTVGSKYEFCPDCNIAVSDFIEIATDSENHSGNALTMAFTNGAVTYTCACGAVVYTDTMLLDTVYVSENGLELVGAITEIGTAAAPFKNFTDAMQYAAYLGKDVTINILDSATTPEYYVTPAFDATVTVTGGKLITNNRFVMNGKFVFEHIEIAPTITLVMAAKEHKLVMGEGITVSGSSIYLVGGYESGTCANSNIPASGYTSDITLRSGSYGAVGGGNRYLSGAYSGTIKLTIGATNENDTLEITSTLTTASMNAEGGNGVNATLIIDGPVFINSFCPVSHAGTANGRFDIDIVVKGAATTMPEKLYWRGSDYLVTVYADNRVDGAEDFAATVVGAENVLPYKRYCIKVNGEHPDANGDTFCDDCGSSVFCEHESGEWRETVVANCANAALYTWYCYDCKELVADKTQSGENLDGENHISEDFTWQYADGKYFYRCTACQNDVETENTVYVSQNGDNALDGTTAAKAVATVEEAVARLANVGGTVVICGEYNISGNITLPEYKEEITISGFDNAGEYGSFNISKNAVITLGGATKFDKIGFGGSAVYIFECAWNDTTFGTVQPYGDATAYIILGKYNLTENDDATVAATLNITEGTSQRHTVAGSRYVERFYAYIYLGNLFGADGVSTANKSITFNATNADIGILYTMSTSGRYKNNPVDGCEATVNLYGTTKVDKGRTGDYNVGYAESTAVLETQTLNFFDNSYIGSNYYIRNAKDTVINVSTVADGRTVAIRCPFVFYAYGTFATNNTPMNVKVNGGTHSFTSAIDSVCTFTTKANALKVYSENLVNECAYTAKVTVPATPDTVGTKLYSCYCGRTYTEEYAYSCSDATHVYIAVNGAYLCTVCGETFESVSGDNVFALAADTSAEGEVALTLGVNGTFAAALVKVVAPSGFTLASLTDITANGFAVNSVQNGDEYILTVLSENGADNAADFEIALVYTYGELEDGEHLFTLTVPELYGGDGNALVATTASANITTKKAPAVAEIGDVKFETLADAFAAAVEGDTIVSLEKITVTGTETWNLEGKTLVLAEVEGNYALVVKGNLTIEGGNFVSNGEFGIGVTGTLTINGGTFTSEHAESYLIGTWGVTTVNGGTFRSVYNNVNAFAGKLTINGGDFAIAGYTGEYESADVFAESGVASIYGGKFSTDPSEYLAEGYVVNVTDGVWGVEISPEPEDVLGDVNGDGDVNVLDVMLILKALVDDEFIEDGDMNDDGVITLVDVIRVLKTVAE